MTTDVATLKAKRINQLHAAAMSTAAEALKYAIECGHALSEAKAELGHGNWEKWLEANCEMTSRTASRWMKIASHQEAIEDAKSIREALTLLAPPKIEPPNRTRVSDLDDEPDPDFFGESPASENDEWEDVDEPDPVFGEDEPEEQPGAEPRETAPTAADPNEAINKELESLARDVRKFVDRLPDTAWLDHEERSFFKDYMQSAAHVLRSAKIVGTCPKCNGDGCKFCRKSGVVNKQTMEALGG